MESDGSGDNHCVNLGVAEQLLKIIGGGHFGMQSSHVTESLIAGITDNFEMAFGQLPQVADQVRAPIAAPNYTDRDCLS